MKVKVVSDESGKIKVVDIETGKELENVVEVIWKGIPKKKSTAIIILNKVSLELVPDVALMTCTKCQKCGTENNDLNTKWGVEKYDPKEIE